MFGRIFGLIYRGAIFGDFVEVLESPHSFVDAYAADNCGIFRHYCIYS